MKHHYFLSLEGKFKAPKLFLSDLTKFVNCDNYRVKSSAFPPSFPLHVVMIVLCQLHGKYQDIVDGVVEQTYLSWESVAACKIQSLQDASRR